MTCGVIAKLTSLRGSAAGRSRSPWRDGRGRSGPGSCPCQPFSVAGLGAGSADPRHLWPAWMRLIRECRPDAILGEQVPGAVGHGWLDLVSGDLEAEDYAVGSVVLGAHSAGAPHIRQRLWWVADATSGEAHAATAGRLHSGQSASGRHSRRHRVADAAHPDGRPGTGRGNGSAAGDGGKLRDSTTATNRRSAWAGQGLIPCADGKARPTQPGIHPLAHGVPGRVGQLRAYGNAIVPQVGAAFVRAFGIARSLPPALD